MNTKKTLNTILGLVCVTALLLGCAENADGSVCLPWSLSCLAVSTACALVLRKLNPAKK